jgi:hypothetical protein
MRDAMRVRMSCGIAGRAKGTRLFVVPARQCVCAVALLRARSCSPCHTWVCEIPDHLNHQHP